MNKPEIMKLVEKYQKKADTAYANYQETGSRRYYTAYQDNGDMAKALRIAANSADEHNELIGYRNIVTHWADAYQRNELTDKQVAENVLAHARFNGLIKKL